MQTNSSVGNGGWKLTVLISPLLNTLHSSFFRWSQLRFRKPHEHFQNPRGTPPPHTHTRSEDPHRRERKFTQTLTSFVPVAPCLALWTTSLLTTMCKCWQFFLARILALCTQFWARISALCTQQGLELEKLSSIVPDMGERGQAGILHNR